jgi:hypothetical protein
MYPPSPEAAICVKANHIAAERPTVVAAAPLEGHGEIAEKPNPNPRITKISESAAAAAAPAKIAPHETPLERSHAEASRATNDLDNAGSNS